MTKLVEVWAAIPYVYDPPLAVLNDFAKATTLPAGLVVVVWLADWFQDDVSCWTTTVCSKCRRTREAGGRCCRYSRSDPDSLLTAAVATVVPATVVPRRRRGRLIRLKLEPV